MSLYLVTRNGRPVGIEPQDAYLTASTPLSALEAYTAGRGEVLEAASRTASVRVSGLTYRAEQVA